LLFGAFVIKSENNSHKTINPVVIWLIKLKLNLLVAYKLFDAKEIKG